MSAREIIDELPKLTPAELQEIQLRINELACASVPDASSKSMLHPQAIDGRLVLSGSRTIRQSEVDAILAEFP